MPVFYIETSGRPVVLAESHALMEEAGTLGEPASSQEVLPEE
jgi:hypothetical protein